MKRIDEALATFREAEQSHLKLLAGEPNHIGTRRGLATLYLTLGDLFSGLGVCTFARAIQYDTISQTHQYCPPDLKARATARLDSQLAREYYRKASDILSQLQAEDRTEQGDLSNLAAAREKLRVAQGS